MKLFEIPLNTLVELHFYYLGVKHKISAGLLYKNAKTVYVSAIKNAGKTIPASKLKSVALIYKTVEGVYAFVDLSLRSISYNGHNLYVVQTEQEAQRVNHSNAYRLSIGVNVAAKIVMEDANSYYIHCILKDISRTGMGIISNKKIDQLSKIEITFCANEDRVETLVGNIIHIYEFKSGKGFLYGCEFDMPNETLGRYIEIQQEKANRKMLLIQKSF